MINFDRLIDERDIPGLVKALRYPGDADLRLAAARALGDLGEVDAVEPLILSYLNDPDPDVRAASHEALQLLAGADADLAIASYGSAAQNEEWLTDLGLDLSEDEAEEEPGLAIQGPYAADMQAFIDVEDLEGLVVCLRHPTDADLRRSAASALGELGDFHGVEYLLRAYSEDPDPDVREQAYQAIYKIRGPDTPQTIADFEAAPRPADQWLVPTDSNLVELQSGAGEAPRPTRSVPPPRPAETSVVKASPKPQSGAEESERAVAKLSALPEETEATASEVRGLVAVLSGERDLAMRLKAIQALKRIHDMHAVEVLASSVLYSDDAAIRLAARKALEELFGEDTPSIVESYRASFVENEDEEGEEGEEEEEAGEPEEEIQSTRSQFSTQQDYPAVRAPRMEPVIREEGFPWRWALLAGIGLVIIIALVLFVLR